MRKRLLHLLGILTALLVGVLPACAQEASWTAPFPAFHIAGDLYYVGSQELAAYLVATPDGLILINSNLDSSPPLIRKSIESLGFKYADIKILLISQGHNDHCAGSAQILHETGAKYYVMKPDVDVVQSGGRTDFHYGRDESMWFDFTKVDRALSDGDQVKLGGAVLTAHLTAGHNKGTTTWTMDEVENGRTLHAVIVGGTTVNPGYQLVNNRAYPEIAADFARAFDVLDGLPCDIFLGAHASYFDLDAKYAHFAKGDHEAFIDPAGYKAFVADRRLAYQRELARQQAH